MTNLTDLDEGDLKFTVDFRQVYATIVESSLKKPSKLILGDEFRSLDFL